MHVAETRALQYSAGLAGYVTAAAVHQNGDIFCRRYAVELLLQGRHRDIFGVLAWRSVLHERRVDYAGSGA